MRQILVIGKSGQVAQALSAVGGDKIICAGRDTVDLRDAGSMRRTLEAVRPATVINAGAYTSVDGAESEAQSAQELNVQGPGDLARACDELGVPLIHLSTDCVFDGTKATPYTQADVPHPLGIYGRTKLAGEVAVRHAAPHSLIVRVSWVFSVYGGNFVRTMLTLARKFPSVKVVSDQTGCPTHAPDLATALLEIAQAVAQPRFAAWGVYHLAGAGETDRASMARQIFLTSREHGGPSAEVVDVLTSEYPTPASRPLNARLDMSETTRVFGVHLPDWKVGLNETVRGLLRETIQP